MCGAIRRDCAGIPYASFEHVLFYRMSKGSAIWLSRKVTSSCLCKKGEGAGLPLLIEFLKFEGTVPGSLTQGSSMFYFTA